MRSVIKLQKLSHLVLRVRELNRSERFYTEVLGLQVTGRVPGKMTFFSLGEESHDLAILAIGLDAPGPDPGRIGLYHFAYSVGSPDELHAFHQHLKEKGVRIAGSGDHGISQGIYFLDPDDNEIEVFYELPRSQWPTASHHFVNTQRQPETSG